MIELWRFAHDAENGATVRARSDIMVDHAVDARRVDRSVGEKRRGRDWEDAFGVDREHGYLPSQMTDAMMADSPRF
ncbi:MAG TPA: hypothetical protein VGY57_09815, partial [Vicinamibacterales bacterium]|nr:hypothetical protein [Vicinamibacterales bacterium]